MARMALETLERPAAPLPALREPSTTSIRLRAASDRYRHNKWTKLFDHTYPSTVRRLLHGRQLQPLLEEIEHTGMQLSTSLLCLNAARLRHADSMVSGPSDALGSLVSDVQVRERQLKTLAALLTMSNWDMAPKLAGLTRVRDVLQGDGMSLASFNFFGDNYLHLACRSPTTAHDLSHLLRFFLQEGVDCNRPDNARNTPAHLLSRHANPTPALLALILSGAQPNTKDASGYTVMHRLAGMPNSQDALGLCHAVGGNLQSVSERGETLLHMTLANHDDPVATEYLVRNGVSPLARDHMGLSAIDYAEIKGRTASRLFLGPVN